MKLIYYWMQEYYKIIIHISYLSSTLFVTLDKILLGDFVSKEHRVLTGITTTGVPHLGLSLIHI